MSNNKIISLMASLAIVAGIFILIFISSHFRPAHQIPPLIKATGASKAAADSLYHVFVIASAGKDTVYQVARRDSGSKTTTHWIIVGDEYKSLNEAMAVYDSISEGSVKSVH